MPSVGFRHSDESKAKMRAAKLARPTSYWRGKTRGPLTPEWREKIAAAGRGRVVPEDVRGRISASLMGHAGHFRGRTHSEATRALLRAKNRGQAPRHTARVPYGGHLMRSGFEVRVAKALDALGITWEYEPKRFDFGDFTYAPDFYLSDDCVFWEVKGWYGPDSQRKVEVFRREVATPLVLFNKQCVFALERAVANRGDTHGGRSLDR